MKARPMASDEMTRRTMKETQQTRKRVAKMRTEKIRMRKRPRKTSVARMRQRRKTRIGVRRMTRMKKKRMRVSALSYELVASVLRTHASSLKTPYRMDVACYTSSRIGRNP
jgi:hypothetical protein